MMRIATRSAALIAAAALCAGCFGHRVSRVDMNWGTAVRDSFDPMIANPDGSPTDHDPGAIADGQTIGLAMKRLRAAQAPKKGSDAGAIFNIGMISP